DSCISPDLTAGETRKYMRFCSTQKTRSAASIASNLQGSAGLRCHSGPRLMTTAPPLLNGIARTYAWAAPTMLPSTSKRRRETSNALVCDDASAYSQVCNKLRSSKFSTIEFHSAWENGPVAIFI